MILMVVSFAIPRLSQGQSVPTTGSPAPERIYHLLREDDDWSFLTDPAERQEFWDPIKYIRMRPGRNDWFLSIGGEAREVWEQIGNDNWGQQPFMNSYLNERYMLYFDVHYGKHVRSFVEFKSGLNSYRIGGPRPIDEKKLDFQAAFLEVGTGDERNWIKVRAGRHELEWALIEKPLHLTEVSAMKSGTLPVPVFLVPSPRGTPAGISTMKRFGNSEVSGPQISGRGP
jgi:hypothetical protein